jgi:hypothetical protein
MLFLFIKGSAHSELLLSPIYPIGLYRSRMRHPKEIEPIGGAVRIGTGWPGPDDARASNAVPERRI